MNIQLYVLTYISIEFSDFNDASGEHNLKSTTMKILEMFKYR